jgi:hypothetical protein
MMTDADILDAYLLSRPDGPEPFILRLDKHIFLETGVTWQGLSFLLRLAEALPGPDGPIIEMQSKAQLAKQTLDFVENR